MDQAFSLSFLVKIGGQASTSQGPKGLKSKVIRAKRAQDIAGWAENDRGVSFIFGPDVVSTFLQMLGSTKTRLVRALTSP